MDIQNIMYTMLYKKINHANFSVLVTGKKN